MPFSKSNVDDVPSFVTDTSQAPQAAHSAAPARSEKKPPAPPNPLTKAQASEAAQVVQTPTDVNEPFEINPKKLIAQKRREYEKREGASLELVISQPCI